MEPDNEEQQGFDQGADAQRRQYHFDEETSTSKRDDMQLMIEALRNERNCPDILHFNEGLTQRVHAQLQRQEELVTEMSCHVEQEVARVCLQAELRRARFLLKAYYRARLDKIERFYTAILDDADLKARLSGPEQAFCREFFVLTGRHLKATVLDRLPADSRSMVKESSLSESKDMVALPNLEDHVFCKVTRDAGEVAVDDEGDQVIAMKQGDLFFIKYDRIQDLIRRGEGVLI